MPRTERSRKKNYPLISIFLLILVNTSLSQDLKFKEPYEINVVSDLIQGEEIGAVQIEGNFTKLTFHLKQVLNGRITFFTGNESNAQTWESIALNATVDDCSEITLQRYQGNRRLFCINKKNGKIFTTRYFEDPNTISVGKEFSLEIIAKYNNTKITKPYFVKIVDYCDQHLIFYENAVQCSKLSKPEKALCQLNSTDPSYWRCNITSSSPYYAVGMEISVSKTNKTRIDGEISLQNLFNSSYQILLDGELTNRTRTIRYPFVGKLINNLYFKEEGKATIQSQFGVGNFDVTQLIITDNVDTCSRLESCSQQIKDVDFRCVTDDHFLVMQNNACKGKRPINFSNLSRSVNTPILKSQKLYENKSLEIGSRRYELTAIRGPTLNASIIIDYPIECGTSNNIKNKYFCMNEKTGTLYSTVNITDLEQQQVYFEIELKIVDTSFPMTAIFKHINLTLNATCALEISLQDKLGADGCAINTQFIISSNSSGDKKYLLFDISTNKQIIIGLKLQLNSVNLTKPNNYSVFIFSSNFSYNVDFVYTTADILILPLKLPPQLQNKPFLSISLTDRVKKLIISKEVVQLLMSSNWKSCADDKCLTKYNTHIKSGKSYCITEEDKMISAYYSNCQDLQPIFIEAPVINGTSLQGCGYSSNFPVQSQYTYWLINNIIELKGDNNQSINSSKSIGIHLFSSLKIEDNFVQNVSYKCVLFDPMRMRRPVESEEIVIPPTKISPAFLDGPVINGQFLEGCNYKTKSPFPLLLYWILNDTDIIQNATHHANTSNNGTYRFPPLKIPEYFDDTEYKCGIFLEGKLDRPVVSNKIKIPRTEMQPTFLNGPVQNGKYLEGCDFNTKSPFPLKIYWLRNDTDIIQNSTHTPNGTLNLTYRFPRLEIAKFFDTAVYQCGIFLENRMNNPVLSSKLQVTEREIKPFFTSDPSQNGLVLKGCSYTSNISLQNYTYWLINENITIKNNLTNNISNSSFIYTVSNLYVDEYLVNGSYQCGIFDPDRMKYPVLSSKIYPRILKPKFISGPIMNSTYLLRGCSYLSEESLWNHTYWLIDGKTTYSNQQEPFAENNIFPFPTLVIESHSNETLYQCGIYNPKIMTIPLISSTFKFVMKEPFFTSGPKLQFNNTLIGNELAIEWCKTSDVSAMNVKSFYWLKNGIEKIDVSYRNSDIIATTPFDPDLMKLQYSRTTYENYGFYQCVMELMDDTEKKSDAIDVKFKDVSKTTLDLLVNELWKDEYRRNTSEQSSLKEGVLKELNKNLNKKNAILIAKQHIEFLSFGNQSNKIRVKLNVFFNQIDSLKIIETCDEFQLLLKKEKFDSDSFEILQVRSYDCCFKDVFGHVDERGVYEFDTTLASTLYVIPCAYNNENQIKRQCQADLTNGALWEDADLTKCKLRTQEILTLNEIDEVLICSKHNQTNCSSIGETANGLSNVISKKSALKSEENIALVTKILTKITTNIHTLDNIFQGEKVLDAVLNCFNVVVASPKSIVSNTSNNANNLLISLEKITRTVAVLLEESNKTEISFFKENIALKIKKITEIKDVYVIQTDVNGNVNVEITVTKIIDNATAAIIVPKEAFESSKLYVHSIAFRYDTLFESIDKIQKNGGLVLDGNVLSATVGGKKIENLKNPVQLIFKKILKAEGTRNCYFWDFRNNSDGSWSNRGCNFINQNEVYIYCHCNHLTNFALLLDASQKGNNPFEMKLVTWIGCGISILGLFMTIISYGTLSKLRAKLAPKLLLCLCFSLTMLLIIFIAGAERAKSHRLVCKVVAALLQYFTLSTFFWMGVEAYNLYRCFVKIFKSKLTDNQLLLRASLLAWGAPLMITLATSFTHPDKLGTSDICIIYGTPFYYGLLLPVAVIIFGNFVAFYFVITGINHVSKSTTKNQKEKQEKLTRSRIAFTCSLLLGLSWAFAVLAIGDVSEVFQWLFCIFTSLQGFFIFIFYTVKNNEVWDEWKRLFGLKPLADYGSSSFKKSSRVGLYATSSSNSIVSTRRTFSFFRRSTFIIDDVFKVKENKM